MYGGVSSKGSTNYRLFFFLFSSSSSSSSSSSFIITIILFFFFCLFQPHSYLLNGPLTTLCPLWFIYTRAVGVCHIPLYKKILLFIGRDLISSLYLHFNLSNLVHLLTFLSKITFPLLQFHHRFILHYDTKCSLIF